MKRRKLNRRLGWALLIVALTALATGLVMLLCFHVGDGAFSTSALGLSKLAWLNLHRGSTALLTLGVMIHVSLHWRPFRVRLAKFARRKTKRRIDTEVIMYATFIVAAVTGLVLWLVLEGASPLRGPALAGPSSPARHPWIDTHFILSLLSLAFVVHHTAHRWRFLGLHCRTRAPGTNQELWPQKSR